MPHEIAPPFPPLPSPSDPNPTLHAWTKVYPDPETAGHVIHFYGRAADHPDGKYAFYFRFPGMTGKDAADIQRILIEFAGWCGKPIVVRP